MVGSPLIHRAAIVADATRRSRRCRLAADRQKPGGDRHVFDRETWFRARPPGASSSPAARCKARRPAGPAGHAHDHAHPRRREVVVAGKRVKTIDVHAHCCVPKAMALIKHPLEAPGLLMDDTGARIAAMDAQGIDVEALSINPYWYRAERDVAAELIKVQNETLVEFCAANPDRFVGLRDGRAAASRACRRAGRARRQEARLRRRRRGRQRRRPGTGRPGFHPFWAKCEELACWSSCIRWARASSSRAAGWAAAAC